MSNILTKVKKFLVKSTKGEAEISDELVNEFAELCATALKKQFTPRKTEYSVRMSGLGKPLIQQQCDKLGLPKDHTPEDEPYLAMKFFIGDLIEAASYTIMKAAGIKVDSFQEQVSLNLSGQDIKGTLDVIINGKVYDIKSASDYSFECKFQGKKYKGSSTKGDGFCNLLESDSFGYVMQGYLYAESKKLPFGGWIVVNKSTGEWHVTDANDDHRERYLKDAAERVKVLSVTTKKTDIDHSVPTQKETLRGVETGKNVLHYDYTYFPYKTALGWSDVLRQYKGKYYTMF